VSRSAFVLSQCSIVQTMLEKLYTGIKQNTTEIEEATKSIVHNLEFKISTKIENNMAEEDQSFKINKFCQEAFVSIKDSADVLQEYETMLTELGNIRMPEFKVTREAYFIATPIVLTPEFKTLTNYCVNTSLQDNLFVF